MQFSKPHLATNADLSKIKLPVIALVKVDGCRLLVQNGKATGRSLKVYKNKKLTSHLSNPELNGIDCELADGGLNDALLCSNTTSCVNTIEGNLPKQLMVFDLLNEQTMDLPFSKRFGILQDSLPTLQQTCSPILVSTPLFKICNSVEDIEDFYQECLDQGYEGVILRDPDGLHKNGRCTVKEGAYLRIKPTEDAEGVVLRIEEAYENLNEAKVNELGHTERSSHKENKVPKGMIGAMWIDTPQGEMKIGAGKMTHDMRKYYFEHQDEILGQIVKYSCLGTGVKDKIRHGRFISFRSEEDMSE